MTNTEREDATIQPRKPSPLLLLKNVEFLGHEYRKQYLGGWVKDIKRLETNWFEALRFVFERTFMRGRRDELSNEYLCFSLDRLRSHLLPSNDLDEGYQILLEYDRKGLLDSGAIEEFKKRHGLAGRKNSIPHPRFQEEVVATNSMVRLLTTEARGPVSWPAPYSPPERHEKVLRLGNDKDVMMVLDTLRLLCRSGCPNVYCFLLKQIRSDGPRAAYRALESLHGVADKLAIMTIRDLGIIHPNLITTDFESVFPIDTWFDKSPHFSDAK